MPPRPVRFLDRLRELQEAGEMDPDFSLDDSTAEERDDGQKQRKNHDHSTGETSKGEKPVLNDLSLELSLGESPKEAVIGEEIFSEDDIPPHPLGKATFFLSEDSESLGSTLIIDADSVFNSEREAAKRDNIVKMNDGTQLSSPPSEKRDGAEDQKERKDSPVASGARSDIVMRARRKRQREGHRVSLPTESRGIVWIPPEPVLEAAEEQQTEAAQRRTDTEGNGAKRSDEIEQTQEANEANGAIFSSKMDENLEAEREYGDKGVTELDSFDDVFNEKGHDSGLKKIKSEAEIERFEREDDDEAEPTTTRAFIASEKYDVDDGSDFTKVPQSTAIQSQIGADETPPIVSQQVDGANDSPKSSSVPRRSSQRKTTKTPRKRASQEVAEDTDASQAQTDPENVIVEDSSDKESEEEKAAKGTAKRKRERERTEATERRRETKSSREPSLEKESESPKRPMKQQTLPSSFVKETDDKKPFLGTAFVLSPKDVKGTQRQLFQRRIEAFGGRVVPCGTAPASSGATKRGRGRSKKAQEEELERQRKEEEERREARVQHVVFISQSGRKEDVLDVGEDKAYALLQMSENDGKLIVWPPSHLSLCLKAGAMLPLEGSDEMRKEAGIVEPESVSREKPSPKKVNEPAVVEVEPESAAARGSTASKEGQRDEKISQTEEKEAEKGNESDEAETLREKDVSQSSSASSSLSNISDSRAKTIQKAMRRSPRRGRREKRTREYDYQGKELSGPESEEDEKGKEEEGSDGSKRQRKGIQASEEEESTVEGSSYESLPLPTAYIDKRRDTFACQNGGRKGKKQAIESDEKEKERERGKQKKGGEEEEPEAGEAILFGGWKKGRGPRERDTEERSEDSITEGEDEDEDEALKAGPRRKRVMEEKEEADALAINKRIADELKALIEAYEVEGKQFNASSTRKAVKVIESLTYPIDTDKKADELLGRNNIGPRTVAKIKEIIHSGGLESVQRYKSDPKHRAIEELLSVWGIGRATAERMYRDGIKSVEDLRKKGHSLIDDRIKVGLAHFEDLNERIPRKEIAEIEKTVVERAKELCPGCEGMAVGSYRRGKSSSGDVDILITHPEQGREKGLLPRLLASLQEDGFVTDHLVRVREDTRQWMGVCKLPSKSSEDRRRHRRVDIKVYPADQFPFALLYFTGSAYFNRSMRHYAEKKGYSLSDKRLVKVLRKNGKVELKGDEVPCKDEADIFRKLGLRYVPPNERNV